MINESGCNRHISLWIVTLTAAVSITFLIYNKESRHKKIMGEVEDEEETPFSSASLTTLITAFIILIHLGVYQHHLLHGFVEYLILIGQLLHSTVCYL